MECEYFEKCDKIIQDCGGWKNIINEDLEFTLELLLRFALNYKNSFNHMYSDLLNSYLELKNEKIDFVVNPDLITIYFKISDKSRSLTGNESFKLFDSLLEIIHKFQEISNENTLDIKTIINNLKVFFSKWRNLSINTSYYSKHYLRNEYLERFNSLVKGNEFDEIKKLICENEIINFKTA